MAQRNDRGFSQVYFGYYSNCLERLRISQWGGNDFLKKKKHAGFCYFFTHEFTNILHPFQNRHRQCFAPPIMPENRRSHWPQKRTKGAKTCPPISPIGADERFAQPAPSRAPAGFPSPRVRRLRGSEIGGKEIRFIAPAQSGFSPGRSPPTEAVRRRCRFLSSLSPAACRTAAVPGRVPARPTCPVPPGRD